MHLLMRVFLALLIAFFVLRGLLEFVPRSQAPDPSRRTSGLLLQASVLDRPQPSEDPSILNDAPKNEEKSKILDLIARDDRDGVGAYLHQLVEENHDQEITAMALALLGMYRRFDQHRDADVSYLWTLFAQKLGEWGELEISHYLAEKATDRKRDYRDAWIIRGYDELLLHRFEEAEVSLLTAYELDPGNHHIQYLLGLTYFELKKPELSTRYLLYARQNLPAVKEDKRHYENIILEKLAENAMTMNDYPLAWYYYEALAQLQPQNKQALNAQP